MLGGTATGSNWKGASGANWRGGERRTCSLTTSVSSGSLGQGRFDQASAVALSRSTATLPQYQCSRARPVRQAVVLPSLDSSNKARRFNVADLSSSPVDFQTALNRRRPSPPPVVRPRSGSGSPVAELQPMRSRCMSADADFSGAQDGVGSSSASSLPQQLQLTSALSPPQQPRLTGVSSAASLRGGVGGGPSSSLPPQLQPSSALSPADDEALSPPMSPALRPGREPGPVSSSVKLPPLRRRMWTQDDEESSSFLGAKQQGCGPEVWGITLDQLDAIRFDPKYLKPQKDIYGRHTSGMTMRDVVERIVKPATAGKGVGYALLKNLEKPLLCRVMVSHAWDEAFDDFISALTSASLRGPMWICAMAIYQPEDIPAVNIKNQIGPVPEHSPFATVLRQVDVMVCVATRSCNLYTRMWCVYEMFFAIQQEVKVVMAQAIQYSEDCGFLDTYTKQLEEPINSRSAYCGNADDERRIRHEIESGFGGYDVVDTAVEVERMVALLSRSWDSAVSNSRKHKAKDTGGAAGHSSSLAVAKHQGDLQKLYGRHIARQLRRITNKGSHAKPYTHHIAKLLTEEDVFVRRAAARALGDLGEMASDHVDPLALCALEDDDIDVRAVAAESLGKVGGAATPCIRKLASIVATSPREYHRCRAARAISFVGEAAEGHVDVFSAGLKDPNKSVRMSISGVLASLGAARAFKRGLHLSAATEGEPSILDQWEGSPEEWAARKELIKANFKNADTNQDGVLDFQELETLLRRGRPDISSEEVRTLFYNVDKNRDGSVTFDEFVDFVFRV